MDFEKLRILRALVVDPHLSRTAERLGLTQSALSKRVQAIENEVGCPLFERCGPRGLKPLAQALDLAQLADRMVTAWDSGVKRVQRTAAEPEHFVLVGPELFLREIVRPWWRDHHHEFPELRLEVQVSSLSRAPLETIRAGADAGIIERKEELADFVCKPIYRERWGLVRHPSLKGRKSLSSCQWGTHSVLDNPVDTWLVKRQKIAPPSYRLYWADLTALAVWVSETPDAASVLPWHVVVWLVKKEKLLFDAIGPEAETHLFLAYPKDHPHQRFLKALARVQGHERTLGEA
ncbi:MAG: LysR family transcriptional regulator [Oligoflexia bacterium]|nr:LysR family transcriptional regulator [Oligoflexia bacterium]